MEFTVVLLDVVNDDEGLALILHGVIPPQRQTPSSPISRFRNEMVT
ncbi:hypothetical protein ACFPRL_05790 [Pseudoclavibacter helvolus]